MQLMHMESDQSALETFTGMLERMAAIESHSEQAPPQDAPYHTLALDALTKRAGEHLTTHPTLIELYRNAGQWAVDASAEDFDSSIESLSQLRGYVEDGLLDSLTIEEIEERLEAARLQRSALPHLELAERAFGDLFVEKPEPKIEPKKRRSPQQKKKATVTTESASNLEDRYIERVTEILEVSDCAPEMISFTQEALVSPVSLLRLRETNAEIRALDANSYTSFKQKLSAERERVIELLASRGLGAEWTWEGNTRGRTYQLVIGQGVNSGESVSTKPNRLEKFESDLLQVIKYIAASSPDQTAKQSYASVRIGEWLDVDKTHASELIDRLVRKKYIEQVGIEKGSPILRICEMPPVEVDIPKTEEQENSVVKRPVLRRTSSLFFSNEEVGMAGDICSSLSNAGDQNKGLTELQLETMLKIEKPQIRRLVAKMSKAGICKFQEVVDLTSDKREKVRLIKFPSQGAWLRFQKDSADYLSILPVEK